MRKLFGAAVLTAALFVPAVSAQAGSLTYCNAADEDYCFGDNSMFYVDNTVDGEANTVTVTEGTDTLVLVDSTAVITQTPAAGTLSDCTISADGHTATCPAQFSTTQSTFTSLNFRLGKGDDGFTSTVAGSETTVARSRAIVNKFVDLDVSGSEGNDTLNGGNGKVNTSETFRGGPGNDTTNGNDGDDFVTDFDFFSFVPNTESPQGGENTQNGGPGNDDLRGGPGVDRLNGGAGDDFIEGEVLDVIEDGNGDPVAFNTRAADIINGEAGFDEIAYRSPIVFDANHDFVDTLPTDAGANINLNDALATRLATTTGNGVAGENDSLTSIEDASGTEGVDLINGSATSNFITGAGGNDKITGGAGPDLLSGNDGDDELQAADGELDRVFCGGNAGDKAFLDQLDNASGCPDVGAGTTVTQVAPPGPVVIPPDTAPPVITVSTNRRIKAKRLRRRGLKCALTATDTTPVRSQCTLTSKVRRVVLSTAGEFILAEKRRTFTAKTSYQLKIAKKFRKAVRKGRKLRLLVQVTDAAGNTTARRVNIRVT